MNRSTNRGDEISTYASELRWILEEIVVALEGLTTAQLDWRPAPTANSAHAIARHVVAATRVYALGFGCGTRWNGIAPRRSPAPEATSAT